MTCDGNGPQTSAWDRRELSPGLFASCLGVEEHGHVFQHHCGAIGRMKSDE